MTDATNSSNFRQLLPRPGNQDRNPPLRAPFLIPKRTQCDGARPICTPCTNRGQQCHYSLEASDAKPAILKRKYESVAKEFQALQQSHENLEQLFHAVQNRSENDAAAIVHRIRQGVDPGSILRHLQAGDLLVQLHTQPETRFRNEFPYRPGMPVFLETQQNPPQYLKPYLAAEIVDPRLDQVKPAWTNVSTDDDLMRRLLRFLGYKFFAEAKRLWELELMEKSSITTVQAAMIFHIMYNIYSMDKLGMTYGVQAVAMAKDLKLFDPSYRP
ncbi:zn(2)-c6 fungal-type DNA-binding domain protein [Fusarium flagelliforme]|uniref:Zn(2)-c6 fungal-type DNA-binding domain protein n=1 Tax=Fusarium flagelliforme TaxID=2675880 RepID=A0A395N495_9HYPO|nr:zn(2)-c6 fungal-type DNA-binding domain protein [Fusarium flagelliforme]